MISAINRLYASMLITQSGYTNIYGRHIIHMIVTFFHIPYHSVSQPACTHKKSASIRMPCKTTYPSSHVTYPHCLCTCKFVCHIACMIISLSVDIILLFPTTSISHIYIVCIYIVLNHL